MIETAYRQLKPGENGIDAAKTAVSHMQQRGNHIRELIGRLSVSKPAAKTAVKKSVGTKSALKKTANKKGALAQPTKKNRNSIDTDTPTASRSQTASRPFDRAASAFIRGTQAIEAVRRWRSFHRHAPRTATLQK